MPAGTGVKDHDKFSVAQQNNVYCAYCEVLAGQDHFQRHIEMTLEGEETEQEGIVCSSREVEQQPQLVPTCAVPSPSPSMPVLLFLTSFS